MWILGEFAVSHHGGPADSNVTSSVIYIQGRSRKHRQIWDFVQHHLRMAAVVTHQSAHLGIRSMYILSLGHLCLSWVLHYASRSQRCMSSHVHSHSLILLSRLVRRLSLVGLKAGSII